MFEYTCNITGNKFILNDDEKDREGAVRFNFNSRFRALCYVFTHLFFGECKIFSLLPVNKKIKGIGMSDSSWSLLFAEKFNYVNTFYHQNPYLNIYNNEDVSRYTNLDFIISSDVFEHIDPFPSIQIAFDNLFKMLKEGGYLIFSVPYNARGEHVEHFPNLYEYRIEKNDLGEKILINKTRNGNIETFKNLCFHGGDGNTLEMRIFSKKSCLSFLEKSGFVDVTFYNITEDMNKYGIFWDSKNENDCSLIISAKKPKI